MVGLLLTVPGVLIDIFLDDNSLAAEQIAVEFVSWFWPAFLFNGVTICIAAYSTAMHKPIPSACIAISRSLILPGLFLLTLPVLVGDAGVFMAIPAAEFAALFIAIYVYRQYAPARLVARLDKEDTQ